MARAHSDPCGEETCPQHRCVADLRGRTMSGGYCADRRCKERIQLAEAVAEAAERLMEGYKRPSITDQSMSTSIRLRNCDNLMKALANWKKK